MRSLSECLSLLLGIAQDLVTKPQMITHLPSAFDTLAAEIRHADTLPAEGPRATRAALMMLLAIEAYFAGPREPGSPWLMLAGSLLPLLRVDAWLAFNSEKAARASS